MPIKVNEETKNKITKFLEVANVEPTEESFNLYRVLWARELSELALAFATDDLTEMLDGISDCRFVNLAMWHMLKANDGLDSEIRRFLCYTQCDTEDAIAFGNVDFTAEAEFIYDKALDIVCDSNLTKFDTAETVNATIDKYNKLNVPTYTRFNEKHQMYGVFVCDTCIGLDDKVYDANKLLKSSVNFKEPDFRELVNELTTILKTRSEHEEISKSD